MKMKISMKMKIWTLEISIYILNSCAFLVKDE